MRFVFGIPEANFENGVELTIYSPTTTQPGGGTGNTYQLISDTTMSTVPEPGSLVLMGFGLAVLLLLHRRRVVHFNVTEHPTAAWTAQQIVDAFPDDSAPSYLPARP